MGLSEPSSRGLYEGGSHPRGRRRHCEPRETQHGSCEEDQRPFPLASHTGAGREIVLLLFLIERLKEISIVFQSPLRFQGSLRGSDYIKLR